MTQNGQVSVEAVRKALESFRDPELGRSVVQLGQVQQLAVEGNRVALTLGLTTYSAPLWKETETELASHLRARLPAQAELEIRLGVHARPPEKIGEIGLAAKSVIAVGSGKGGVGKSTIAASLAYGLSRAGSQVGLMDADVYGPSIPHLLGSRERPYAVEGKIQPVKVDGLTVMSMGFLIPPGEAVVWRGPMLHGAIKQFLADTAWGELDYLIIDMPPGTGDVALTLSQLLPLSGAVVVCTPQDVALLDAIKAIAMFRKVNIEILGMVENMSYFLCPNCQARHEIFGSGGARQKASELGIPFLGEVPLNTQMRIQGDEGRVGEAFNDPASAPFLEALAGNLVRNLVRSRRESPPLPSLNIL